MYTKVDKGPYCIHKKVYTTKYTQNKVYTFLYSHKQLITENEVFWARNYVLTNKRTKSVESDGNGKLNSDKKQHCLENVALEVRIQ